MKNTTVSGTLHDGVDDRSPLVNGINEVEEESDKAYNVEGSLGKIETPFGALTKDGKYLVAVSPNGNISLFRTNVDSLVAESKDEKLTGKRILEFTSRVSLTSNQKTKKKLKHNKDEEPEAQVISSKAGKVTCLAVAYQPLPNEDVKTVKRRKTPESNDVFDVIIAVGFHLGEVVLRKSNGFSDLEVFRGCPEGIQAHKKRQVSSICFSENASKMFSSGHDGNVVVWERTCLSSPPYPKKSIMHESSHAISCIACNKDGTRLAVGDTEISLYDVEKGSKILLFHGHSNPISNLAFFLEDSFLLSCSSHENNAYIWACDVENYHLNSNVIEDIEKGQTTLELNGQVEYKKASKRTRSANHVHLPRVVTGVLRSKFPIRFVNVLLEDWGRKCCFVSCIIADGTMSGYQVSWEDLKKDHKEATVIEAPSFTTVTSTFDDAVFATATDTSGTFVLFGHGGFLKPIIEAASFSELLRETSLRLEPKQKGGILRISNAFSHLNEASNRLVKHLQEEREAEVLKNTHISTTSPQTALKESPQKKDTGVKSDVVTAAAAADSEEEQTLEAKLNHLNVNESVMEPTSPKKLEQRTERPRRNIETSIRILEQSIIYHDQKLLERALTSVTDKKQIQRTIGKLDSSCVVPLLRELIVRFESNPNRAKVLLVWIQSILIRHASFLSSTGELVDDLRRLQQVMVERMDLFQSILELEGRLELIIAHTRRNLQDNNQEQPMFEYDEEGSEGSQDTDVAGDE